jgi:DNA-directed RNA polymerase specialized sigma24 family protein
MRGFDFDKALVALQNELHCFAYKLTADKDEAENLLQSKVEMLQKLQELNLKQKQGKKL